MQQEKAGYKLIGNMLRRNRRTGGREVSACTLDVLKWLFGWGWKTRMLYDVD
jgi:hypothetical protein